MNFRVAHKYRYIRDSLQQCPYALLELHHYHRISTENSSPIVMRKPIAANISRQKLSPPHPHPPSILCHSQGFSPIPSDAKVIQQEPTTHARQVC